MYTVIDRIVGEKWKLLAYIYKYFGRIERDLLLGSM